MPTTQTQTVSFRNFTSYRLKKDLETGAYGPYQTGIYTHASGQETVGTSYDYKKKNQDYQTLVREAHLLTLITEKQARRKPNVTVPQLLTVIDRAGRIILMRTNVEGVVLTKVTQGAKVAAYRECINELERITGSLTPDEKNDIPQLSNRNMKRAFPGLLLKAFLKDQGLLFQLIKLARVFYRYRASQTKQMQVLASRSLTAPNIVCGKVQVVMTDLRNTVMTEEGTDEALFPQLYYREVGTDTMRAYLDESCKIAPRAYRFLHLAAFYALYFEDLTFIQILADSIVPYVTGAFKKNPQPNRNLTLAVTQSNS